MVASRKESFQGSVRTLKLTITGESDLDCFYARAMGFHRDIFPTQSPLLPTDVNKLVKILGEQGVQRVLISGAEPLLRKDAPGFVKAASAHRNIREVRLITNGTNLKSFADPLRKMGLKKNRHYPNGYVQFHEIPTHHRQRLFVSCARWHRKSRKTEIS